MIELTVQENREAIDYYFYQVRNDFRQGNFGKHLPLPKQAILGLIVADLLRYILEHNIDVNEAFSRVTFIDFFPRFIKKKRINYYYKKKEMKDSLQQAYDNSKQNAEVAKEDYVNALAGNNKDATRLEYHVEKYRVLLNNKSMVTLEFHPYPKHEILVKQDVKGSAILTLCSIQELCFISVQMVAKTVEISRKNGIPHYLTFKSDLLLRSFVSLLDGYYRLTEKWSFSLCKEVSSPRLLTLKSQKCHGPVGSYFATTKLCKKSQGRNGTYLIRESTSSYDQINIDIMTNRITTFSIEKTPQGYRIGQSDHYFNCFSDVINQLSASSKLCLPPSEYDQPELLLLCQYDNLTSIDTNDESQPSSPSHSSSSPIVFSNNQVNLSKAGNTNLTTNSHFSVTRTEVNKREVVVKEILNNGDSEKFLKTINQWICVKNECIVTFLGVTLHSPLSLIMEYLPLGPLDEFIKQRRPDLKPVDLIECTTYFARALWYLEEKGLVHGSIRCHNLLVSSYSPSSLKVKLSDPLSTPDMRREAPWIAPEIRTNGLKASSPASDVWAFGTTLWEIFSYGQKPDFEDVNELLQPLGCQEDVWELIKECWIANSEERKQPQSIVRDLSQILYEVYNSRRVNDYSAIDFDKADNNRFIRSIFGSVANISRSSIMSTSTLLTGLDTSRSDIFSIYGPNEESSSPNDSGTWIIEANQLSPLESGKVLGQVSSNFILLHVFLWSFLVVFLSVTMRVQSDSYVSEHHALPPLRLIGVETLLPSFLSKLSDHSYIS